MKRDDFFALLSAVILVLVPGAAPAQSESPVISIDEPVFHAGEVREGTRVSHGFTVTNKGGAVLEIHRVSPG
jgi:hypothetical protein